MQSIRFTCTALKGNKKGVLMPDDDGYYTQPLCGLNVFNSRGEFYTYNGSRELFESSSAFMRRVTTGCLKSEEGHPKPLPGQSLESFTVRFSTIEEKNVCAHISDVWIDFNSVVDNQNKPIIAIMGKVKPAGPYGRYLAESFENGKEDVCFSIRAFTNDIRVGAVNHRALKEIITFDRVTEPGIDNSRKYRSPCMESYIDKEITREQLLESFKHTPAGMSVESHRSFGIELFQSLGWEFDKTDIPKWANW